MNVTEISDHMLINDPAEKEDLLLAVRCLCSDKLASVLFIAK